MQVRQQKPKFIRSTTELPEWFDINRYLFTENLTIDEWRHQLRKRYEAVNPMAEQSKHSPVAHLFSPHPGMPLKEREEKLRKIESKNIEQISKLLIEISADPALPALPESPELIACREEMNSILHDIREQRRRGLLRDMDEEQRKEKIPFRRDFEFNNYYSQFSPVTFFDLSNLYDGLDISPDDSLFWSVKPDECKTLSELPPISDSLNIFIKVDINASNNKLEREFRDVISEYRDHFKLNEPKKPSTSALRKLHEYKILPFIDLKLWAKCENIRIKNSTMAIALFPHGEVGEYEIRARTQCLADKVLTKGFINSLE